MKKDGTLDAAAAAKLPVIEKPFTVFPTPEQITAAKKVVTENWTKAIAG